MVELEVRIILEILGRPADNVKEALNTLVVKLGSEKGISLLEKIYHDPVPLEGSKDLFTAFAELTLKLDALANYFGILFAYMPAHVEILRPENFHLQGFEFTELGNKLLQRLHEYDAITKKVINERNFLISKLKEFAPHLFKDNTLAQTQNKEKKSDVKKPKSFGKRTIKKKVSRKK